MLKEIFRVTKTGGSVLILTAAKEIFEEAYNESIFAKSKERAFQNAAEFRNDVLVNGKKAAVYIWKKEI